VIAAVLLGPAGSAIASSGSHSDPHGDFAFPPPKASADYDIVKATYKSPSHGWITQTVSVAGHFGDPAHGGIVPDRLIDEPGYPNARSECDYYVGKVKSRLGVFLCGTTKRIATAKIVRSGSSTLRYSFQPKKVGSPKMYEWVFILRGQRGGTTVDFDRVPDVRDGTAIYRMR
jgi:hypothetical protein